MRNQSSNRSRNKNKSKKPLQPQYDEKFVQKKLQQLAEHRKFQNLKIKLKDYLGKNYPITYNKLYEFSQQWENKQKKQHQSHYLFNQDTVLSEITKFTVMIVFTATVWYRSLDFFFNENSRNESYVAFYLLNMMIQCFDGGLKLWFSFRSEYNINFSCTQLFKVVYQNVYSCAIFLMAYLQVSPQQISYWSVIQIVNFFFLFVRARQIYQQFRLKSFVLAYQYQLKVFDLLFSLVMIAHFFAIVLYLSGAIGQQKNWLQSKDLLNATKFQAYIYSFYYCTTTILTVGYGDISPQNTTQVAVVILVQIFGIATFAYIINEIGFTMGALRKERQVLEKDLLTIKKMKYYYKIQDDLMEQARKSLINATNQVKDQLTPEQENSLIVKLNEDLRNNIFMQNALSVIKSSIFFLCRWSKSLQTAVSSKLQHKLFSPEQRISQPLGRERIYIVRLGRIEIFPDKRGCRKELTNLLKKIQVDLSDEVCNNCFGYTGVISKFPINLKAIAKKFTSCYFIQKDKFKECVKERFSDEQYFHQVKDKIQLSPCPLGFQIPKLMTDKLHYNPTKFRVLENYVKNKSQNCIRIFFNRSLRKGYKANMRESEQIQQKLKNRIFQSVPDLDALDKLSQKDLSKNEASQSQIDQSQNSFTSKAMNKSRLKKPLNPALRGILMMSDKAFALKASSSSVGQKLVYFFQQVKQYENYYKMCNISNILNKYQRILKCQTSPQLTEAIKSYSFKGEKSLF